MENRQLHLVRHGEVHNPDRVLYGRIPGFKLSDRGHEMTRATAEYLAKREVPVAALIASPLERAQQSAAPIAEILERQILTEERIIEPSNWFEGMVNSGPDAAFKNPKYWYKFWNPFRPSWGEAYESVAARVLDAMNSAWEKHTDGDVIMVSHQSPIWMAHLRIAGKKLFHDPSKRRCDLSSVTSFVRDPDGKWREVGYVSPAQSLLENSVDVGAV